MPSFLMSGRSTLLVAIVLLSSLPSCLTPPPSRVGSPDEELGTLLEQLHDARGGTFAKEAGIADTAAAREGRIRREIERLAVVHPRHVPVLVANASLAYERNDPVGAQKYLDQALALDPSHTQATLLRVRIAAEAGNLPYARRMLRDHLELAPDRPELHEALGGILYLTGDYDEALAALDVADRLREVPVEGEPATPSVTHYHRGLIAEARGDFAVALESYRRSQEQSPDFEPAAVRLKWLEASSPAQGGDE